MKRRNLISKTTICLYLVLTTFLFASCDDYPVHMVFEGHQNMIVYKVEKINDAKYGDYKYAVTDASGKGWELRSFTKFEIGDTLRIVK